MRDACEKSETQEGDREKEKKSVGTLDNLVEEVVAGPSKMALYGPHILQD